MGVAYGVADSFPPLTPTQEPAMRARPIPSLLVSFVLALVTLVVLRAPADAQTCNPALPTYGPTSCAPVGSGLAPVEADAPLLPVARLWSNLRASVPSALASITRWDPRAAFDSASRRPAVDRTRAARVGAR